jgi:signal transduction histidine kinase/CheY-like chemotaxis protein
MLTGVRDGYIPMAPNTSVSFIILGLSLAALPLQRFKTLVFVRAGALLVLLVILTRLCEYATGGSVGVDGWFFQVPGESVGLAPVGKMAFFTSINFLLAAVAILTSSYNGRSQLANDGAKALAVIAAFVGLAFALGYLYGAPLMYGGKAIPMALNTSIGFFLLGTGAAINAFARDLLDRRHAREELRKAHEELERRVEERTAQLTRANEELAAQMAERKKLEQQFLQAQKMEAIGRLAGGVAHDFNNLLTAIIGYSDLVLMRTPPDDPLRNDLDEIRKAGERAATLTQQLLAFSRKQILQPKLIDLNTTVIDTTRMLRRLVGEDVEMVTVLKQGLWQVKADPGQIEQVLMNLAVNARDAMPGGGKLTVETANSNLDEGYAGSHLSVAPGKYVMLAVSDTGCGMDSHTQAQIFEPFFTTKEQGKGTGLGLATVYGIVKQSGGHVWVYSEVGRGTTFKVYLPQACGEADALESQSQSMTIPRGMETVLLVEDDLQVSKFAAQVLGELGYRVIVASNGTEALEVASSARAEINLVLTDVVMPKMGGKQLADELRSLTPDVKVLFISGYTQDAIVNHGILDPGIAFLHKPFTPGELARKVRQALDEGIGYGTKDFAPESGTLTVN